MSIATVIRIAPAPTSDFADRARFVRAGIVNVHRYANTTFDFPDGRFCLLGTNGSGKSRGMDMLLPFLLSGDRRRMGSSTSGTVTVESLMRKMIGSATNRVGYTWVECALAGGTHLTIGAYLKYSTATRTSIVEYFITPLRVGFDLSLVEDGNRPLAKEKLTEQVGSHRITSSGTTHRERVAQELYGIADERGMERYRAYLDLLYKLRAPDIGVRINGGELTQLLSESLPPLSDEVLTQAGTHLDGLGDIRDEQQRLERQVTQIDAALQVYAGYTAAALDAAAKTAEAADLAEQRAREHQGVAQTALDESLAKLAEARQQEAAAKNAAAEAQARISAIERSSAYRDHLALNDRSATVAALAAAADSSLTAASGVRRMHDQITAHANRAAEDVLSRARSASSAIKELRSAAVDAGLATDVPDVRASTLRAAAKTRRVRLSVDADEVEEQVTPVLTPTVAPTDLEEVLTQLTDLRDGALAKRDAAAARSVDAAQLERDDARIESLEAEANTAAQRAVDALAQVEEARASAGGAREALAEQWVAWAGDERVRRVAGSFGWTDSPIGGFLDGLLEPFPDLTDLDRLPDTVAMGARTLLDHRVASANVRSDELQIHAEALRQEQADLIANRREITPARARWVSAEEGAPFWRTVDFRPEIDQTLRDRVEAALDAAGVLTAVIAGDRVHAADGELLVDAAGPVAGSPLSGILCSDGDIDVSAILERIGFDDALHPTSIASDGSFRVGQLRGKPAAAESRFIGHTARERARQQRLDELANLIADIDLQQELIAEELDAIQRERSQIADVLSTAPSSEPVRTADADAAASARHVARLRSEQLAAETAALDARAAWDGRMQTHRSLCALAGLPWQNEDLTQLRGSAERARRSCVDAVAALVELQECACRFDEAADRLVAADADVTVAESKSSSAWRQWSAAAAELDQLHKSVGAEAAAIRADHARATTALSEARERIETWGGSVPALAESKGNTETELAAATTNVEAAVDAAAHALGMLRSLCQQPGVLTAASGDDHFSLVSTATAEWVRTLLAGRPRTNVDSVHGALDTLIADVASDFEVVRHTDEDTGVLVVQLLDAEGVHSLAHTAMTLRERFVTGRAALAQEEHDRFQRYILDSVGEELRQAILLAQDSIKATSQRVSQYRTSNGIGVKLRITANDALGPDLVRIRELVGIAGPIRTEHQTEELTRLLRTVVEQEYSENPGAGYEAALSKAFDYRNWFTVEALILGPEPDRVRGIRGAQLSSGELRYVSYLTLTCAIDAQMSALPPVAPRLLLMDDAFAMVDPKGRRNLVQVMVERDIDFVMTGFDLWLTYPEAPGVDLYEIHAHGEDAPAAAVHYRWDGHNKRIQLT